MGLQDPVTIENLLIVALALLGLLGFLGALLLDETRLIKRKLDRILELLLEEERGS